jgi:hypothetical protein
MRITLIFVFSVIAFTAFAAKVRNWQTGTLLDSESSSVYLGTISSTSSSGTVSASTTSIGDYSHTTGAYSGGSRTSSRPMYAKREVHLIDSDSYVYIVSRLLYWRWNKSADVTINAPIRFATDKQTMYLLDDEGREHKTQIIKRILKTPEFARALAAARGVSPGPQPTPAPAAQVVAISAPADPTAANAPADGPQFPRIWKSATSAARYSVRLVGDYLYAELILPDVERTWNLFTKIEGRKDGKLYVGKSHWAGYCGTTSCPFDDQIEFTFVTPTRIEGALQSYPVDAQLDCETCQFSKRRQITKFVWIPE